MNERIKLLAEQAGISILYEYDGYDGHAGVANLADIEKLAQSIIRECRDIVGRTRDRAIEDGWNVDEAMSTAMFDIEEHFGVE